ncbi:MAG: hypothetical protein K0S32_3612 [Bacteroidetes bacterium]|jgi:hypothetical protein|nr:hypothetical protein [Bacteroidota bacterium]
MKILNIFFIVLFIISAALQYNDPDPYIWMPIYLWAAFLCYLAVKERYNPYLYYVSLPVYLIYAAILFFSSTGVISWYNDHGAENIAESMKATKPWIEETREFFGLLIVSGALSFNMMWFSKKKLRAVV